MKGEAESINNFKFFFGGKFLKKFMKKLLNFILNFIRKKHKERITDIISCDFSAANFFQKINHLSGYFFRIHFFIFTYVFNFHKITQAFYRINRNFKILVSPNFSQFINHNKGFEIESRENFLNWFYVLKFGFKFIAIMTLSIFIKMPVFVIERIFSFGVSQSQPFRNWPCCKKISMCWRKIFINLTFLRLKNSILLKKLYQWLGVFDINLNFNFDIFVCHKYTYRTYGFGPI